MIAAIYDIQTRFIVNQIEHQPSDIKKNVKAGQAYCVLSRRVDDRYVKIGADGKTIIPKTPEEIKASVPPPIPPGQKAKSITKDEWDALLERIVKLENRGRNNGG